MEWLFLWHATFAVVPWIIDGFPRSWVLFAPTFEVQMTWQTWNIVAVLLCDMRVCLFAFKGIPWNGELVRPLQTCKSNATSSQIVWMKSSIIWVPLAFPKETLFSAWVSHCKCKPHDSVLFTLMNFRGVKVVGWGKTPHMPSTIPCSSFCAEKVKEQWTSEITKQRTLILARVDLWSFWFNFR